MIIEKISKLKNDKYKIIIDGETIKTYDDIILKYNILFKKEIDLQLYKKIIDETKEYDVYNDIYKYSIKKIRSEKEILDYMSKLELSTDIINKYIEKLKKLNIINDNIFVSAYINDKFLLSQDGKNKIIKDLLNNNINIDKIYEEIDKIEQSEWINKLTRLIEKKIKANHNYSSVFLKKKIIDEMIEKGYEKSEIIEILDNLIIDDYKYLLKEYNKLYKKYSKKYDDVQLMYNIKQGLYRKGFKYEDIKKEDL